jgi:hypothetical protein
MAQVAVTSADTPRVLVAVVANAEVAPMVDSANAHIVITFKLDIILLFRVISGIGLRMGLAAIRLFATCKEPYLQCHEQQLNECHPRCVYLAELAL